MTALFDLGIDENIVLPSMAQLGVFGVRRLGPERSATRDRMNAFAVKAASPSSRPGELSGGNQQKLLLARWMTPETRVLLLDEPTRGIDVGSKAQIYKLMGELAAQGKAVIFVSSYLPELLGVCDTIGVMCRGVLSGVRPAGDWTEHGIIATAIGQTEAATAPISNE